jgi:hypothetical protein
MTQAKARVINYDCNSSIMVLATGIMIVNYVLIKMGDNLKGTIKVAFLQFNHYSESHFANYHSADYHSANCHSADCHSADCHSEKLSFFPLSFSSLSFCSSHHMYLYSKCHFAWYLSDICCSYNWHAAGCQSVECHSP